MNTTAARYGYRQKYLPTHPESHDFFILKKLEDLYQRRLTYFKLYIVAIQIEMNNFYKEASTENLKKISCATTAHFVVH